MIEPTLVRGDCIELMQSLETRSVDLVIADPPYNLGKDYGNGSDSLLRGEYLSFTRKWLEQATRILKRSGSLYVFMGFRFISHLFQIMEEEMNLHFNSWICWYYTQGMGRTKGFSPRHDDILFFTMSENFTFNLDAVRVPQKFYRSINNMRGANPGDVWEFSHVHYCQGSRTEHPTQKPEGLIERMVLASSNEGDLVLDPFSGSGTTLRVCQQLNRQSIGFELSQQYIDLSRKRLGEPFGGFDGIDPRMTRIPNDLNDPGFRAQYRLDHKRWFLKNHDHELQVFEEVFRRRYPDDDRDAPSPPRTPTLFDQSVLDNAQLNAGPEK